MVNRGGNNRNSDRLYFLGLQNHCSHEIKRHLFLRRKTMMNLDSIFKSRRHYFADKGLSNQSYGFSSSCVWMWELDLKEGWVPKNWCFWTRVLEKTLESPFSIRKDWCWSWSSNTLATWCKELTHWKRHWCWERLKVGERYNRAWDGWMASLT